MGESAQFVGDQSRTPLTTRSIVRQGATRPQRKSPNYGPLSTARSTTSSLPNRILTFHLGDTYLPMTPIWNLDRNLRIVVAGSRTLTDCGLIRDCIDKGMEKTFGIFAVDESLIEIVSGGCPTGPDEVAINLAKRYDLPLKVFHANWDRYGKAAGPKRNRQMPEYADVLIAVWDGKSRGTLNMIQQFQELNPTGLLVQYIVG